LEEVEQIASEVKHAPKINTETCRINWSQPIEVLYNLVRGLSPHPGAFTVLNEKVFKIYKAKKEAVFPDHTEGDYVTDGKSFLKFACANGYLHLLEVQLEGKKKMEIAEFLKGYRFAGN
jgi:methionyl-tRNA formyltransferase